MTASRERGSLLLYGLLALAILGAAYLCFQWVDNHWETDAGVRKGKAETQALWDAANEKQRKAEAEKSAKAATNLEKGNASAKVIYRTITQTVDRYIDRPIYRAVVFDDDGLRDANSALVGALAPAAKPDGTMSKPNASK